MAELILGIVEIIAGCIAMVTPLIASPAAVAVLGGRMDPYGNLTTHARFSS